MAPAKLNVLVYTGLVHQLPSQTVTLTDSLPRHWHHS